MTPLPASGKRQDGPLLDVRGLTKEFVVRGPRGARERLRAVDGLDLQLAVGETVGLVGESGCGKSTAGRCILRLIEPTAGTVHFDGVDMRRLKGRRPTFRPVCPPIVGRSALGRSRAMIRSTTSGVIGST